MLRKSLWSLGKYCTAMKLLTCLLLLLLMGCKCGHDTNKKVATNNNFKVAETQNHTTLKDKLIGIWTDGMTENATFDIQRDSIVYIDQLVAYRYTLKEDCVTINYPDWNFVGHVSFAKDTLVISSEDGQTKYWRFKQ